MNPKVRAGLSFGIGITIFFITEKVFNGGTITTKEVFAAIISGLFAGVIVGLLSGKFKRKPDS